MGENKESRPASAIRTCTVSRKGNVTFRPEGMDSESVAILAVDAQAGVRVDVDTAKVKPDAQRDTFLVERELNGVSTTRIYHPYVVAEADAVRYTPLAKVAGTAPSHSGVTAPASRPNTPPAW